MQPCNSGITLVELLVTIAVITILALIAVPSMRSTMQNYRVSGVTEQLYSALQYARSEAVKRNGIVYVSFTTGDNWCYGINPTSACNCTVAGNCTLGSFSAPAAGQNSLSSSYSSNVFFEGSHGTANASGTFTFTVVGTSRSLRINVGRLGALSTCSTDLSGYNPC